MTVLDENEKLKKEIFELKNSTQFFTPPPSPHRHSPSPDSDLKLKMAKLSKSLKSKIVELEKQLETEKSKNVEISTQNDDEIKALIEKNETSESAQLATIEILKSENENLQKFVEKSANLENQLQILEQSKSSEVDAENLTKLKMKNIEIESTNQELESQNAQLRNQLADSKSNLESKLETNLETIEKLQSQLNELEKSHQLEISNLEISKSELSENLNSQLENREIVHKSEIAQMTEKFKSELEKFKTSKEMELKVLAANHQSELENIQKSQFNSQTTADAESAALVQQMKQNHDTEISQLMQNHETRENDHQLALEHLNSQINSQTDTNAQLQAVREELNSEKALVINLEEHHKTEISDLLKNHELGKSAMIQDHQMALEQLRAQLNSQLSNDTRLENILHELNAEKALVKNLEEHHKTELENLRLVTEQDHAVAVEQLQSQLNSQVDGDAQVAAMRQELNSEKEMRKNLEEHHKNEISALVKNHECSKTTELNSQMDSAAQIEAIHRELNTEKELVKNLEEHYKNEISELVKNHESAKTSMAAEHQLALDQFHSKLNSQLDNDAQLEAVRQELNAEKELVKHLEEHHHTELLQISETINQLENAKSTLEQSHLVELEELKSHFNSQATTSSDLEGELKNLAEKHQTEISRHQVELDQVREELAAAQVNSQTTASAKTEAENEISRLKAELQNGTDSATGELEQLRVEFSS